MPVVFSLIFIVGLIGNGCVISAVLRYKSMRSAPNIFIGKWCQTKSKQVYTYFNKMVHPFLRNESLISQLMGKFKSYDYNWAPVVGE